MELGTKASKDKLIVPRGSSAVVLLEQFEILPYHALEKLGTKAGKRQANRTKGKLHRGIFWWFEVLPYHALVKLGTGASKRQAPVAFATGALHFSGSRNTVAAPAQGQED